MTGSPTARSDLNDLDDFDQSNPALDEYRCGTSQHRGLHSKNVGPNHLGMRCKSLPEHRPALMTSGCVPFRDVFKHRYSDPEDEDAAGRGGGSAGTDEEEDLGDIMADAEEAMQAAEDAIGSAESRLEARLHEAAAEAAAAAAAGSGFDHRAAFGGVATPPRPGGRCRPRPTHRPHRMRRPGGWGAMCAFEMMALH